MTTFERFTADVAKHELTVLKDDGLYRHLRCRQPGTYFMAFDIITWPGWLAYTGDMGSYVFSRIPDMFEFFRGPSLDGIDFSYWAQKCEAEDKVCGVRAFSRDLFDAAVKRDYDSFVEHRGLDSEEAEALWADIEDDVLPCDDTTENAIEAASRFQWRKQSVFEDFWEHRLEDYTHRFRWCGYALRWAIAKYDATKVTA